MMGLNANMLNSLAINLGLLTSVNKQLRIDAMTHSLDPFIKVANIRRNEPLRVVSVDVGLKNFAYCKMSYDKNVATLHNWDVSDLNVRYGKLDPIYKRYVHKVPSSQEYHLKEVVDLIISDTVDSKLYLSRLAVSVVDEILLSQDFVPHVITIESQRIQNKYNKSALPPVLASYMLEHMIYAVLNARLNPNKEETVIFPIRPNKLVNFWLSRFVTKKAKMTPARSKEMRALLIYSWIEDEQFSPYDISSLRLRMPENFSTLKQRHKLKAFLDVMDSKIIPTKEDDLVDSFLYNVGFAKQFEHIQEFLECEPSSDKYREMILRWNQEQILYLRGSVEPSLLTLSSKNSL